MSWLVWVTILIAFGIAFTLGTFLEYFVHRLMHSGTFLGKKHARHHQAGFGQGWLGEFFDYSFPSLAILWVGFLYSTPAGWGFVAGGACYAAMAAYAHQLQHEQPQLVFWLKRPVHYLHHEHKMWRHNFGILVDVWDRIFGTYKVVEWTPERRPFQYPWRQFFQIKWF